MMNAEIPIADRNATVRSERSAELLLLVVVFIWALNSPLVKFGLSGLSVYVFNSIRYLVAAALIAALLLGKAGWVRVHPEDRWRLLRLGLVANVLYQLLFILGISMTTAGNSAVLLSTSPLWTAVFNSRINREKVHPQAWFGMGVSLVGVVMIILGSGKKLEFGSQALYGDLLTLAAAALWALNTTLQRPLLVRYPASQLALISISIGAVGLTLLAIPSALTISWSSVEPVFWLVPVLSGATAIAIANILWSRGVKVIGPHRTGNYGNLIPVIAFVAAYVLLNEQVFFIQAVGAAVTVVGVWIARR